MEPIFEEENIQKIKEQFDEIQIELNVDQKIADIAWRGYEAVRRQCTLEGSQIPWLACSIFVATWLCPPPQMSSPTSQKPSAVLIIEKCGLSFIDFLEKLQKWVDMANMSKRYLDQVIKMESCFAVASVVFKKFDPIFNELFRISNEAENSPEKPRTRSNKTAQASLNCTASVEDVKRFCWCLFIYLKRSSLGIQDDLIKSHHLMLCCLDLMWSNLTTLKREDLLNKSIVNSWDSTDETAFIEHLCIKYDGVIIDAKQMRIHWFKARIKTLSADNILFGTFDANDFLSSANFDKNINSIQENYDKLITKKGDMDERVFLTKGENFALNGTPCKLSELRKFPTEIFTCLNINSRSFI
uniref:Retinoblastoma-associated protein N-terminal domain-containing protein n=1 Tax=Romanomermis culicivorax TaxID=13658 RepID=A0A915JX33_ROMCU